MDTVQVMRIVIYEGPRDKVEKNIENSIHGTHTISNGVSITALTIKEFPVILIESKQEQDEASGE